MRDRAFRHILALVESLPARQRQALAAYLAMLDNKPAATEVIEQREQPPVCPHCQGTHIVRNGHSGGLQRYGCRSCGKTFNALTGSPLAHLHLRGKWLQQAQALREQLSLTQVQQRLGIARTTALRWRHRFLAAPKQIRARWLTGVTEADETYFLRSAKGQRQALTRPARRRAGKASKPGVCRQQVPVLVVRDRSGQTADFILEVHDSQHAADQLRPIIAPDALLCTEGDHLMRATARKLALEHHAVNLRVGIRVDGPWHVQNVNAYHSRLKGWMARFRGVSTKYLDSYLGWFRTIDRAPDIMAKPASLLALAVGA